MPDKIDLPKRLLSWVDGKPYTCDSIGKSGSTVLCYADMVLKIEPAQALLSWLEDHMPDLDPDILFDKLGIAPDRHKLRYYMLLDELF